MKILRGLGIVALFWLGLGSLLLPVLIPVYYGYNSIWPVPMFFLGVGVAIWDGRRRIRIPAAAAANVFPASTGGGRAASSSGSSTTAGATGIAATIKKCPMCAEEVKREAKICRFCRYEFTDADEAAQAEELAQARAAEEAARPPRWRVEKASGPPPSASVAGLATTGAEPVAGPSSQTPAGWLSYGRWQVSASLGRVIPLGEIAELRLDRRRWILLGSSAPDVIARSAVRVAATEGCLTVREGSVEAYALRPIEGQDLHQIVAAIGADASDAG
jgi:hypothetical protein